MSGASAPTAAGEPPEGTRPSPNIWGSPEVYELENRGVDPDGLIEAMMRSRRPWGGARVLDIGCGSGFHLPRFAAEAAQVVGVEPHPPLLAAARERVRALEGLGGIGRIEVRSGTAQALPVADASVDVAHARWAYFFGPGCEPGLDELDRVMADGGAAFVIDNDATRSTFGSWFRRARPGYDPEGIERFWRRRGWTAEPLLIRWSHETRADLEAVVRIEFEPRVADAVLAEHTGTEVDYAVNVWWRTW